MDIRAARGEDAAAVCAVIRRSIVELCVPDHNDDPAILELWLANKTPDNVARWIADPANAVLVAVEGRAVLAAGCITRSGEILLNYVSPDARFRGISRAMMDALESIARARHNRVCSLESTLTALRFYRRIGYAQYDERIESGGVAAWPMSKSL